MHLQSREFWGLALLTLLNICMLRVGTFPRVEAQRLQSRSADFRIVGGYPITVEQAAFLVQVRQNLVFICGGTLVRRDCVVTAAHCVAGVKARQLRVVAGATTLTQNGWQSPVRKYYLPRGWSPKTINNDVSVLMLQRKLYGPNIRPIAMARANLRAGTIVRVYGWGKLSQKSTKLATTIRAVDIPIISWKRCAKAYNISTSVKSMMCAGVPGKKDACNADSGGPLISGNRLCGIVSFGAGCASEFYPGVYTRIMAIKGFILDCIRKG